MRYKIEKENKNPRQKKKTLDKSSQKIFQNSQKNTRKGALFW